MASSIFDVLKMLEKSRIHFTLERTASDCICVYATLVGERLEIMVFEDDHVELSRFPGNEDIVGEMDLLVAILDEYNSEN
jgi:hypothetical protein